MATYPPSGFKIDAMLCDSAQAVTGKLYMLGAGWNILNTPQFPFTQDRIGLAVIIGVPYTGTNQFHKLQIWMEDQDGNRKGLGLALGPDGTPQQQMMIQAQFNIGRPPMVQAGDSQNLPFAINLDNVFFEAPGQYSFVLTIDENDNDSQRLTFRVGAPNGIAVGPGA